MNGLNARRILFVVITFALLALLLYPVYMLQDMVPGGSQLQGAAKELNTLGKHLAGEPVEQAEIDLILDKVEKIELTSGELLYRIQENGVCWELAPSKTDIPYKIDC